MNYLKDGETKEAKPKPWNKNLSKKMRIFAHRVDDETPYIILKFYDYNGNQVHEQWLEDCYIPDIIDMMNRCLDNLPTSK